MKKNDIGLNLLYLCAIATVITFVVQYLFDKKLNTDVLSYTIPACIVSYVLGRHDERKHNRSQERP